MHFYNYLPFLLCMLMCFPCRSYSVNLPDNLNEAYLKVKEHVNELGSKGGMNNNLYEPAMSTDKKFKTFDGKKEFEAHFMCAGEAPVVKITAFPVGNISNVGELNLKIEYDKDIDGTLEGITTVNNVAGVCGNGIIKNCKPSGSWKNCQYCRWVYTGGAIKEQCDYGGDDKAPIGPQGMQGCFCFNASCGSPTLALMENILSFTATGFINILNEINSAIAISNREYDSGSMQLSFLGAKVSACSSIGDDAELAKLTSLQGKFDFPTDDAIAKIESDSSNPYNTLSQNFGTDDTIYRTCIIESKVGVEQRSVERYADVDFGIGLDANGGSAQCYWFQGEQCGSVFGETSSFNTCVGRIIPSGLSDICHQMLVQSGIYTSITGISDYKATSGLGNYISCYGSGDDAADQFWKMRCTGMRLDDAFICKSASMYIEGKTIKNQPYKESLYQGCEEINAPQSSCATLETKRAAGECEIFNEIIDGVYTIRSGSATGLEAPSTCKVFKGSFRSLTICEPGWKRERVYRCKGEEYNFNKEKERAQYVGGNINFDDASSKWIGQGDLVWDGESKTTKIYDPNIVFQEANQSCIPACKVGTPSTVTDIFVPGQGKLEADGNYHMPTDGELSYSVNRPTQIERIVECEEKAGVWSCPKEPGEIALTGCECFDQDTFGKVVAMLQSVDMAAKDMICSTGQEVGICTPENQEATKRIVCGDFTVGADGEVTVTSGGDIYDCQPKLWRGDMVAAQTHRVEVTDQYICRAHIPAYPEDDHAENLFGPLSPLSTWFDTPVAEAKPKIIELLKTDSRFIPEPDHSCPCRQSGASCTWTVETSVANINREDQIGLRPTSQDPFGDAFLFFSSTGTWGGSISGTCTQSPPPSSSNTASKECIWINNREDCSETSWINYRGDFDLKPQGSGTAEYYIGAVPLASTDKGVDLYYGIEIKDHLGTVALKIYSNGCPDGVIVPGSGWDFVLPDGKRDSVTRQAAVPQQCITGGGTLQVYLYSSGGRGYSGRYYWLRGIQYKKLACTLTAEYGCIAQSQTLPAGCHQDGTVSYCNDSGTVGPFSTSIQNIRTYQSHIINMFTQNVPVGSSLYNVSVNMDSICLNGSGVIEYQSSTCPGWRVGYTNNINCGYHSDMGGGIHVCPVNTSFGIPQGCLSNNLQIRARISGQKADNRCDGSVSLSVKYSHQTCGTSPRYICDNQNICTSGCGVVTKYTCANGLIVTDPNACPRWVCSRLPGASYQTQQDCLNACVSPISCSAQSDDYRFKITIRNRNNDYLSVLEQVKPISRLITSWSYRDESMIMQQCVDRYLNPTISFIDPATKGKFEYGLSDMLVYQYAGEKGQLPRDASSGIPFRLPKYPPVYTPTSQEGTQTVPTVPMFWDKKASVTWTNDNSLRLGYKNLQMLNLTPYVYYYECPTGTTIKSNTNNCGAISPFGGVDWTISGKQCFTHRCDSTAIVEPNEIYGGCGMVSDGTWQ